MNFCMLRLVKKLVWLLAVVAGAPSAFGFALIGPGPAAGNPDDFEVPTIGYALGGITVNGTVVSALAGYPGTDIGTPKNIGEGYRRNTPVIYYSFDSSFLNFFGTRGAAEVDKAMAIYNSLGDVSSYSQDLSELPTDTRRVNFRAGADSLLDVKSVTMGLVMEQLGPWQPSRWVWALHSRAGTPCPAGEVYDIYKRNFDIVPSALDEYQNSSYVNGVLYSYWINEICSGGNPLADAIEFPVDPLQSPYSAVADYDSFWYRGLQTGMFYTYLTRDDVGGLRYLLRTNDLARETAGLRTEEFLTNAAPTLITNQDLNVFAAQARVNDPVALAALYPGLVVTSTITNFFTLAITTNITQTLVNSPFDPAGAPPSHVVTKTTFTTNLITTYQHTFGNVVTNTFSTRGLVGVVTFTLSNSPFAPAGTPPTTNTTVKIFPVNGSFGTFFILPTNLCSAQVLSNVLTTVTITTNLPVTTTPPPGTVNTNTIVFTPGSVTFSTNFFTAILGVSCPTNAVGTFGGVEKIHFIRRDFDSLINQTWDPVTNDYTMVELVTNDVKVLRHFRRTVRRPDFLFTAADLGVPTGFTYSNTVDNFTETFTVTITGSTKFDVVRTSNYNQSQRPSNLAGPGTIESPNALSTLLIYNKIGPFFENSGTSIGITGFIDETSQVPLFDISWGSFDGTTNAPVVYPNGSSLLDLEASLNGPVVTTRNLPDANIGNNYTAQLEAAGGHAPYTWSLAPSSAGLPGGLSISSDGQITGIPSGPASIYDFTVRVTDSVGAFRDVPFTISVF
jgi:hypothetical protein